MMHPERDQEPVSRETQRRPVFGRTELADAMTVCESCGIEMPMREARPWPPDEGDDALELCPACFDAEHDAVGYELISPGYFGRRCPTCGELKPAFHFAWSGSTSCYACEAKQVRDVLGKGGKRVAVMKNGRPLFGSSE